MDINISNTKFSQNGFLHLPQCLPEQMLNRLQCFADELEQTAVEAYTKQQPINRAYVTAATAKTPVELLRFDSIYSESPELVSELLALPVVNDIRKKLCGNNAIPLSADMLFKRQGEESLVLWHQDAVVSKPTTHIVIGIYLDDAKQNDGCLLYVPGSQYEIHDIAKLTKEHGWNIPLSAECPAKAGDIIVHHAMTLHCSKLKQSANHRRTIYIEMQTIEHLKANSKHSNDWISLRQSWLTNALQYQRDKSNRDITKLQNLAKQLLNNWEQPIAPNYGFPPVITNDYPVTR